MTSEFIKFVFALNEAELNHEMEQRFTDRLKKKIKFYSGLDGISSRRYLKNPFPIIRAVRNQILSPSHRLDKDGQPRTPTRFVYTPFQQFNVPKGDGSPRKLSKASIKSILAQKIIAKFMVPRLETLFIDCSYAYRPRKSAKKALLEVQSVIGKGYYYILDADISGFFDNVNHDILLAKVQAAFPDEPELQHLIFRFIKTGWVQTSDFKNGSLGKIRAPIEKDEAGNLTKGCYNKREKGIPQGGILSGLLANLYLNDFDHALQSKFPDIRYVRYADDFLVFCRTPGECLEVELFSEQYLNRQLNLEFNRRKTHRRCIGESDQHKTEPYVDFLGYRVCRAQIKIQPKNLRAYKAKMRILLDDWSKGNRMLGFLIRRLNQKMKGRLYEYDVRVGSTMVGQNWTAYFSLVTNPGQLKALDDWQAREVLKAIRKRKIPGITRKTLRNMKLLTLVRLHYKMKAINARQRKEREQTRQLQLALS